MNMIEKRKAMAGQGGFTLIELLVVIAILAVLGGAVIIGIGALRGDAEEQVCSTEVETIELAAEAYAVANDVDVSTVTLANLDGGEYIKKIDVADWTLTSGDAAPAAAGKYAGFTVNADNECVAP